ncbi:hypothetical protein ISCGN_008139 [Ixodes scapularis]
MTLTDHLRSPSRSQGNGDDRPSGLLLPRAFFVLRFPARKLRHGGSPTCRSLVASHTPGALNSSNTKYGPKFTERTDWTITTMTSLFCRRRPIGALGELSAPTSYLSSLGLQLLRVPLYSATNIAGCGDTMSKVGPPCLFFFFF